TWMDHAHGHKTWRASYKTRAFYLGKKIFCHEIGISPYHVETKTNNPRMKTKQIAVSIAVGALALVALATPLSAAPLTDQNKQFLANYEKVHQALVADDLATAKRAAADLGAPGSE